MPISRRLFIKLGSIVAIAAGLPIGKTVAFAQGKTPPAGGPTTGSTDLLARMSRDEWGKYLHQNFSILLTAKTTWKVELYDVKMNQIGLEQGLDNFSLFFRGVHEYALTQGTYKFDHPKLGRFELFICPAGTSGGANQYEAIFNRL